MRTVHVLSITVDHNGVVYVSPRDASLTFESIYRDASSVRWDARRHALHVIYEPTPDVPTQLQWIARAVEREYGAQLHVDRETRFEGLSPDEMKLISEM